MDIKPIKVYKSCPKEESIEEETLELHFVDYA